MTSFEEALRKTLEKRTQEESLIALADRDLHEVCLKASEAVRKLTDGKARLELAPISPRNAILAYALNFVTDAEKRTLRVFNLYTGGYPIGVFLSRENWEREVQYTAPGAVDNMKNRDQLEAAINSLAANESELIPLVEYVIRNRSEPVGHSKSTI